MRRLCLVLLSLVWLVPAQGSTCELGDEDCDSATTLALSVFAAHSLMEPPRAKAKVHRLVVIPASYTEAEPSEVEMPWIWREIRRLAVARLPKKQVDRVNAMLAPTVVNTGFSSTLGVGLLGKF